MSNAKIWSVSPSGVQFAIPAKSEFAAEKERIRLLLEKARLGDIPVQIT